MPNDCLFIESHYPLLTMLPMCKSILRILTLFFFSFGATLHAVITETITATSISSPAFILDHHGADGDATTLRDGLLTDVSVRISRLAGDPGVNSLYRVTYQLLNSAGTPLELSNGTINTTTGTSAVFAVNISGASVLHVEPLTIYPNTVTTLSNKEHYRVATSLQKQANISSSWATVAASDITSAPEFVHHFTQATSGDLDWNIRATVKEVKWTRSYLLDTDPTKDSFEAFARISFSRFDDWDQAIAGVNSSYVLDFDLIELSSGNQIPLENNGISGNPLNLDRYALDGLDKIPTAIDISTNVNIKPLVQLNSGSESYILRCTVKHVEDAIASIHTDATCDLAAKGLLHFNGNLVFGAITTTFDLLGNLPTYGTTGINFVRTSISVANDHGILPNTTDYVFGDNNLLNVFLFNNGNAIVLIGNSQKVYDPANPSDPVTQTTNKLTYTFGTVTLSSAGINTDSLTLNLPQGLILLPDTTSASHHGQSKVIHVAAIQLNGAVNLASPLTITLAPNAAIVDESHPLVVHTTSVTLGTAGDLSFGSIGNTDYIHDAALTQLENDLAGGLIEPTNGLGLALDDRASNDRYLRNITGLSGTNVTITAADDTSSRMSAAIDIGAQAFQTHFPAYTEVDWTTNSQVVLLNGVASASSTLAGTDRLILPYHKTCPEDPCSYSVPKTELKLNTNGVTLTITPTGGLYCRGTFAAPIQLSWGARGDGAGAIDATYPYAHRTDTFSKADFFAPGYQLYANDNVLLTTIPYATSKGDTAPAALLYAGFNGDVAIPDLHLPSQTTYIDGDGYYPGFNFIVDTAGDTGASRLGGNTVDYPYELLNGGASKYYARCAGVFGRQVGVDGSFSPSLQIYGYDFELTSFQLSFIASEQEDSLLNGSVAVTGHSDFTQKFLGLELSCLGELEDAEIDPTDTGDKNLVYWNSTFTPKAIRFETTLQNPGSCPLEYFGILTMGIRTQVAHIPKDLYGTFGFLASNGNLLNQTTGLLAGIDSELGIPANISIDGPSKDYALVPTGKLRFSNPVKDPNSVIGHAGGFVTFGATIDVPYFRDLQVQVMTSANDSPSAPLYLTPGWISGSETFFSSYSFDPDHASWPVGAITLDKYQTPDQATSSTYLVKAEQDLFGNIPLSYPLKWDDSSRTFTSMKSENDDLFVINVDHQIDYLDAATTKVSFGAKYEGLPEISLTNMLNGQIDLAAQSMSDALSQPLKMALDKAFEEFEKYLADSLDAVIDPVVDEAADNVISPLYDQLLVRYNTARAAGQDWNTFKAQMEVQVDSRIFDSANPTALTALQAELQKLADVSADASSVTDGLKTALQDMILSIDAMINKVELNGQTPVFHLDPDNAINNVSNGLLRKVSGEREIVQNLVKLLLENLAEPEVSVILTPLLNDLSSDTNKDLNALLKEIEPSLDQIEESLKQVREILVEVYGTVDSASGVFADFQQLVKDAIIATDGFQEIMAKPATRALSFIQELAISNGIDITTGTDLLDEGLDLFEEFDKDTFVAALKTELKDALIQSSLMEQFQFILRQSLYDVQAKFEQTVSSVLSQVTIVMKEVISKTIGSLDTELTKMLGDVNDFMSTAEVTGNAEFNGDSLRKLRLDTVLQLKVPDDMQLNAFMEIAAYTSEDSESGCIVAGDKAVEVTVGADDVSFDWISNGLRADLAVKMSLKDKGAGLRPNGVGGSFEVTQGVIDFETFKITCLAASVAIGLDECYLSSRACGTFDAYEVSLGIFFGRTCTVDPLLLADTDVGELFNTSMPFAPMTGAYVYGEVWLPIVNLSCLFNVSAGVGTGVGFFVDDSLSPIFVGKMLAGVSGEALCLVSIKGEIILVGIVQSGSFSASGTGKLSGKAGACPFCIKFSAQAKVTYSNGDWDVDY